MKFVSALLPVAAFLLASCAPPPEYYEYEGEGGSYDQKVGILYSALAAVPTEAPKPSEPRKDYCMVDVPQETNAVFLKRFFKTLSGTWRKNRKTEEFELFGSGTITEFTFDSDKKTAKTTGGIGEDLTYKRICVSKEIYSEDNFFGYRIVELMAENNEGGAAFAVRFEKPWGKRKNPVLLATLRYYDRYGQDARLMSVPTFFDRLARSGKVEVHVFPVREALAK